MVPCSSATSTPAGLARGEGGAGLAAAGGETGPFPAEIFNNEQLNKQLKVLTWTSLNIRTGNVVKTKKTNLNQV